MQLADDAGRVDRFQHDLGVRVGEDVDLGIIAPRDRYGVYTAVPIWCNSKARRLREEVRAAARRAVSLASLD